MNVNVSTLSTQALRRELDRRQSVLGQLQARREQLMQELAVVDTEITELGGDVSGAAANSRGAAPRATRTLPKNDVSLPDALAAAVEVRAIVSPAEAAELVRKNGYVTTSVKFAQIVAGTLAKDRRFKRLERGQYERVS